MTRPRDFQDVLAKLPGARQSGDSWTAPCPAPGHKTPAGHLSLKKAVDKALVTCQGGKHAYAAICAALGFDSLSYSPNSREPDARIEAIYDYVDREGRLLYQVVRFRPKSFTQRRPDGKGGWVWNLKGVKPVLYRLPEVLKAVSEGRPVYVCEGEKDVDNLAKLGLTATTNSGGAEKWWGENAEVLAGASVVIIPDRDPPGQGHAAKVAASLYGKAKSIKVVELPDRDGPQVNDVSDWLAAGGTGVELARLVSEAQELEPPQGGDVALVCMATVQPEAVSWLWHPYIPQGKLALLEGDPGIGKSWVSLAIATAVTRGKGLPGQEPIGPANVLLASAEDGLGDTIRPRLDATGADVSRIFAIEGALTLDENGFALLETYLERVHPALLIIDPLVAYLGATVDIHRANETRAVMARLARLAEQHGCAILAVRHITKGGALKPIYRGLGSIDFTAVCRSVLLAGQDPDDPQKRGLVHIKSNLAPMGKAIGYELRDGGFYWKGESDLTAARILAAEDSGEGKTARDEAADFLRDELGAGPVVAAQVWRDAKEAGLAEATVKRAKAMLGIITRRHGEAGKRGGGQWAWELPEGHLEAQKDLGYQDAHVKNGDTLNQNRYENGPLPKTGDTLNTPVYGVEV